jgi:hypothetical protein
MCHFPEMSNMVATEVSPGTDVTYQATDEGEKTITINKHYEASALIHDRFTAQTKYRYAENRAQKAGYALAKQMDTDVLALYSSATNNVGSGSVNITKANILAAIKLLDGYDVPQTDRHLIVDEFGKEDLFNIDDFVKYDSTGQASPAVTGARQGGTFGDVYGVTVHISTNVPVESASPNVVHGLFLHREAIGLAVQKGIKVEKSRLPEKLSDLITAQVLYGVGALRPDFMVDFRYTNQVA